MAEEIKEEFVKINKEEIEHFYTYYVTNVVKAAEKWKRKSVSFKSPNSGRIFRQTDEKEVQQSPKIPVRKGFSLNKLSRLFEDFKIARISDFEYQPSRVRQDSKYKPFWATKVSNPKVEPTTISKSIDLVERSLKNDFLEDTIVSKSYKPVADTPKSATGIIKPEVTIPANAKGIKPKVANIKDKKSPKRVSLVVHHHENRLKTPPGYKGSKMYMPTGEQLFWVCFVFNFFKFVFTNFTVLNALVIVLKKNCSDSNPLPFRFSLWILLCLVYLYE